MRKIAGFLHSCYSCYGSVKVTYSFCLLGCHTEGKRDGGMHTSCFMNALMSWILAELSMLTEVSTDFIKTENDIYISFGT